jgi:hypothetical protein
MRFLLITVQQLHHFRLLRRLVRLRLVVAGHQVNKQLVGWRVAADGGRAVRLLLQLLLVRLLLLRELLPWLLDTTLGRIAAAPLCRPQPQLRERERSRRLGRVWAEQQRRQLLLLLLHHDHHHQSS